ncbi:chemotaxis protein CheC [Alkalicoccus chagannorensis]|uniref:chemotaxis protein CheC n=1 Tax=Alkalicoccus chagannorensis TaxID=427072 RepID=UPI0003FF5735|nr:chemotaxis protein CheC [Alkalicoccus chagannorensis]
MNQFSRLNDMHMDVLKEIGNIGAAHAATALSTLLQKTIHMHVPSVELVPFEQIADTAGGEETLSAAVLLRIEGEAPGNMFFMIPAEEANELAGSMIGRSVDLTVEPMDPMGASAFNEVGNILAGSYLSSLADFTRLDLQPSPPAAACDMTMALLSSGLIESSQYGDYAIVINTKIEESGGTAASVHGYFFLLPDPESLDKIFQSLGVSLDE